MGDASLEDMVLARMSLSPLDNLFTMYSFYSRHVGDILEVGAFWSIRSRDIPSFDRYYSQLQTFYNDYRYYTPSLPAL